MESNTSRHRRPSLHIEAFPCFGTSDISIVCKTKLRLEEVKSLSQGLTDRNAKSQLQESELLCPLFRLRDARRGAQWGLGMMTWLLSIRWRKVWEALVGQVQPALGTQDPYQALSLPWWGLL